MAYDKETRMIRHEFGSLSPNLTTYTYSGDGLKRTESVQHQLKTLVLDGSDYLGEENS